MKPGTKNKKQTKRGAHHTADCTFVGVLLPLPLVAMLDQAVKNEDTDRSKYFRAALREKLEGAR
jgi:metal-responsive CopG/Arc/MetJ family transcriptional regulator